MMRSKARGRGAQVVFPEASAAPGASARAPSRRQKASRANRTSASKKIATGARACCRSTFQASGFPARPTSSAATVSGAVATGSEAARAPSAATAANGAWTARAKPSTSRSAVEAAGAGPLMQTSSSTTQPCPAASSAARAASSVRASAGSSVRHGTASVKVGAGSGIGGERVEGDAGAYDARIGGGRVAAADRRRERRLEAELACGDGAEEDQVVRRPARRVKAHLPLHDLRLPAEPEPLQRADVRTQARAMHRPRRRHVNGTRPEAGRAVAEVEVLAIEEVARVEAAELPEQVAAHCHERAVHPVHPVRRAPEPRAEAAGGRVEHQVAHGPEAPGRRLPAARIVDQPA